MSDKHANIQYEYEQHIEELTYILKSIVVAYDRHNFMKTGDFHEEMCGCLRCIIDNARYVIGREEKKDE
jgi:hypothetical protein